MLNIAICLGGIFLILQAGEFFHRRKILEGEYLRKFVHILSALFIASWPWLVDWWAIQLLGLAMTGVVIANHQRRTFHMDGGINRSTYGGMLFGIAVSLCACLTHQPIFFALAILQLGLADGLAAVVGTYFQKGIRYKVFGYDKSLAGTLAFWLTSSLILGVGLLFATNIFSLNQYLLIPIALPALLAVVENASVKGFDNITVPVLTILTLKLFA